MSAPTGLLSHVQRVKKLYKSALRNLESWYDRREIYRFHAVLMRNRFDQNKDIKDARVAKTVLEEGEDELFQKQHWHVRKYWNSPGGTAYGRKVVPPDWVLDYWHPLEKAQYPEYFARREQRKAEYIKFWERQFLGKAEGKAGESCDEGNGNGGEKESCEGGSNGKKEPEPC